MSEKMEEKNKALFIRLLEESDKGNLDIVDELYSDEYVDHSPSPVRAIKPGKAGIQHATQLFYTAFPDTKHEIFQLVAEGEFVVAHIAAKGTHTGEFLGIPPTHKEVVLSGIAIYRFLDGRIRERWAFSSQPGVLEQLGIDPSRVLKR